MVTLPYAYHYGINKSFCVNEAVNFATKEWVSKGQEYEANLKCNCEGIVKLDMGLFNKDN